jgi:hypothetical protein
MNQYDRGYNLGLAEAMNGRPCRCHKNLTLHRRHLPPIPGDAFSDPFWRGYRDGYQAASLLC